MVVFDCTGKTLDKTCVHLLYYYRVLHNTAVGIPLPNITWSYNTTFSGIQELTPLNSNTTSIEMGMDDSGRHKVKSILSLRISPTDGGVITCIAGARQESALLTVLGKTNNSLSYYYPARMRKG